MAKNGRGSLLSKVTGASALVSGLCLWVTKDCEDWSLCLRALLICALSIVVRLLILFVVCKLLGHLVWLLALYVVVWTVALETVLPLR